jgi:thioredoxin reductase
VTVPADEILKVMRAGIRGELYQLGVSSRRLTIASQQMRAFNLIWALAERSKGAQMDVAIVGGGIGGVTCAAAAALLRWKVTLFECAPQLMRLQRGTLTRFVHPNIIDWPRSSAHLDYSQLPFLNWCADYADEVVAQIQSQYELVSDRIDRRFDVIKGVRSVANGAYVVKTDDTTENFQIVILATGFGLEKKYKNVPFLSYWHNDNLGQPVLDNRIRRVLVSGSADGAITDVLRLCITDFRHGAFLEELVFNYALLRAKEELFQLLQSAKNATEIAELLSEIRLPHFFIESLKLRKRQDTAVVLHYHGDSPYNLKAAPIHLLALNALLRAQLIESVRGDLSVTRSRSGGYNVKFDSDQAEPEFFDQVVIRHGFNSPTSKLLTRSALNYVRTATPEVEQDLTRKRLFEADYFSRLLPQDIPQLNLPPLRCHGMAVSFQFACGLENGEVAAAEQSKAFAHEFLNRIAAHVHGRIEPVKWGAFRAGDPKLLEGHYVLLAERQFIACTVHEKVAGSNPAGNVQRAVVKMFTTNSKFLQLLLDEQLAEYKELRYMISASLVREFQDRLYVLGPLRFSAGIQGFETEPYLYIANTGYGGMLNAHRIFDYQRAYEILRDRPSPDELREELRKSLVT